MMYGNIQSQFNPLSPGSLQVWLDSSNPLATGILPADSSSLSTFVNKAINGNAEQASGAAQPIFHLNSINGLPAVSGDGSSQIMTGTIFGLTSNPNISAYIVAQYDAVPGGGVNMTLGGIGSVDAVPQSLGLVNADSANFITFEWGAQESHFSPSDDSLHTFNGQYDNATHNVTINVDNVNGSPVGGGATLNLDTTFAIFGHSNINFPFYAAAKIGEYIIYISILSGQQDQLLKEYCRNKWGTP